MSRLAKGCKGFTLLELLVVVIIIGILASVALPQFGKAIDRAREAEAVNIISAGLSGQLTHFQEKGSFTTQSNDLLVTMPTMAGWTLPGIAPNFTWTTTPTSASITADAAATHGHTAATDHQVRGTIDNTGKRTLEVKRPGSTSFIVFP